MIGCGLLRICILSDFMGVVCSLQPVFSWPAWVAGSGSSLGFSVFYWVVYVFARPSRRRFCVYGLCDGCSLFFFFLSCAFWFYLPASLPMRRSDRFLFSAPYCIPFMLNPSLCSSWPYMSTACSCYFFFIFFFFFFFSVLCFALLCFVAIFRSLVFRGC